MAAVGTYSSATRLVPEDSQRRVTKRISHHHHPPPHFRPATKATAERQRKVKRRPVNYISTDGTSGDETGEDFQLSSEADLQCRLEQLLKRPENSDLEADCEDNNSTDVDTVSISGSIKHKNPLEGNDTASSDSKMELLNAKIRNLEKQLATVLSINIKLKEENDRLKSSTNAAAEQ